MANQKTTITEPQREIPVRAEVDVLVVGRAALRASWPARAAAGKGLRVMLIESRGYLGGNMTIGRRFWATLDAKATRLSKDCPSSSSTACVRGAPPANTVPASSM